VYVFYTLATLGYKFEAYKTARFGYEQLSNLRVPDQWAVTVDIEHLKIRSKPFSDKEGFATSCNRCMNENPLTNLSGDHCVTCGMP